MNLITEIHVQNRQDEDKIIDPKGLFTTKLLQRFFMLLESKDIF